MPPGRREADPAAAARRMGGAHELPGAAPTPGHGVHGVGGPPTPTDREPPPQMVRATKAREL